MSVFAMGSRLQGLRTVLEAFMFMLFVQEEIPNVTEVVIKLPHTWQYRRFSLRILRFLQSGTRVTCKTQEDLQLYCIIAEVQRILFRSHFYSHFYYKIFPTDIPLQY